jgi:hypothetical protein
MKSKTTVKTKVMINLIGRKHVEKNKRILMRFTVLSGTSETNEELHNLYSSPNIIQMKRMRWTGHVAHIAEVKSAYK